MNAHRVPLGRGAGRPEDERLATREPSADPTGLLELQRSAGNAAVSALVAGRLSRSPLRIARNTTGVTRQPMTRQQFDQEVTRFGVTRVYTGTLDDQRAFMNRSSGGERLGDRLQQEIDTNRFPWQAWDPGSTSPIYASICAGLADFSRGMGVVPITEIAFFEFGFEPVVVGGVERLRREQAAAVYSGGTMAVYSLAAQQAPQKVIPTGRDVAGAPSPAGPGSEDLGIRHIVTHELGHGVQELAGREAMFGAPMELMNRFRTRVGWRQERLYDIGATGVEQALTEGRNPDAAHRITPERWDEGWTEQPISRYATTGSGEDFAEAVMAFVHQPDVLRQRSPRRFEFVREVRHELAHLRAQQRGGAQSAQTPEPATAGAR